MIKVLVTGVGSTLGYGILKCFEASSLDCHIVGTDYFDTAVGLYWVDRSYILPDILNPEVTEEEWLARISKIIADNSIEIILVGLDFEVPIFARNRETLESRYSCKVVVSSEAVVRTCFDKWYTYQFLREHNLNYPLSCLIEGLDQFKDDVKFPWIVKPRTGSTSKNLFKVNNQEELAHALAHCPNAIIQECIGTDDEEFTCGTMFVGDTILSQVALRRTLRAGNTSVAFCDDFPEVETAIAKVTKCLQPFGPINLQLRMTTDGPTVFEINPRFSGTTPLRARFGVNEVELLLRHLILGEPPAPLVSPQKGVIIRYTQEHFVSLNEFGKAVRV